MYTHVSQVPARRQWEPSSAAPAPLGAKTMGLNCGPTSVAFIADFYRDATFPIEATCDLAAICESPAPGGTSGQEQAVMLAKRGVPATNKALTIAQLKDLIKDGNRPVVIGMLMSRVPAAIRGHSFLGVHATAARENAVRNSVSGVLIMDPNFGYGHTVDTQNGARFYPDTVIAAAMAGYTAVVPNSPKAGAGGSADPMIEALDGYANGTYIPFEHGKTYQFFGFDPTTGARYSFAWTAPATGNLKVPTEGLVDLKGDGPAYFIPSMYANGARKNIYLPQDYATPVFPAPPVGGITPEQAAAMAKKAAHDAALDIATQADITLVTKYAEEKYPA